MGFEVHLRTRLGGDQDFVVGAAHDLTLVAATNTNEIANNGVARLVVRLLEPAANLTAVGAFRGGARRGCNRGELVQERARPILVSKHHDLVATPGDRHVEDASFFFTVIAESVGDRSGVGTEHDDLGPFHSLDPMDRRDRHPVGARWSLHRLAEPCFECGQIRV